MYIQTPGMQELGLRRPGNRERGGLKERKFGKHSEKKSFMGRVTLCGSSVVGNGDKLIG